MCPCPGQGKGQSQITLDGIEDPEEFNHFVLALFQKNMAIEASFQAQMQRYYLNAQDQIVSEETHPVSLKIIVSDDKVNEVLSNLDA